MFQRTNNPYSSAAADEANQKFCTGYVKSYNEDTRTYTVNVTGYGEQPCKQLSTGLLRPYKERAQVVVGCFRGSDWTVIGEVPQPAIGPEGLSRSSDESLAKSRGRVTDAASAEAAFFPSFREMDSAGEPEVPVLHGDVRIENRTERNMLRSFLHIFNFGDILLKAKSACYIYLSRSRSKIVLRARELRERFSGYQRTIETPVLGVPPNETQVVEEFKFNPLSPLPPDMIRRTGSLTGDSQFLTYGHETTFLGGLMFQHMDVTQQTIRQRAGLSFFLMGSLNTLTGGQPLPPLTPDLGLYNSDLGTGISLQTPGMNITMLDGAQTLRLQQGDNTILMSPAGIVATSGTNIVTVNEAAITMVNGGNSVTVSPAGVNITGTTLTMNITGPVVINGTSIDLFAPG